jgi:hypothetical protein
MELDHGCLEIIHDLFKLRQPSRDVPRLSRQALVLVGNIDAYVVAFVERAFQRFVPMKDNIQLGPQTDAFEVCLQIAPSVSVNALGTCAFVDDRFRFCLY